MAKEQASRDEKPTFAQEQEAFAISAGSGAAYEEIMAHERDIRAKQMQEIFLTHTRHKVRMQM